VITKPESSTPLKPRPAIQVLDLIQNYLKFKSQVSKYVQCLVLMYRWTEHEVNNSLPASARTESVWNFTEIKLFQYGIHCLTPHCLIFLSEQKTAAFTDSLA
jgi:hypothetical protein